MNARGELFVKERLPGSRPPFRTLLFDLDGTLLDVEMSVFLEGYFPLLARRFGADDDVPSFRESVVGSVRLMLHNRDGANLLEDVFLTSFASKMDMTPEGLRDSLRDFHNGDFEELRGFTKPLPAARPLLKRALELGYEIVIATNPVFFLAAIEARLRWANLADLPLRFISAAENMHFCKPYPEYFLEILALIGRSPQESVMIGNDPAKDMPASRVGITTFYTPVPGERREAAGADHVGGLEDVGNWLETIGPAG